MLDKLLKLFSKNGNPIGTPLEDFTTEAFAGILETNHYVRHGFIYYFLNLPEDEYLIKTQKKYFLDDDINCIIDIVIEGTYNICFIENKVNSTEGYRQLVRYSLVLDQFALKGKNTHLFYCTKYNDVKNVKGHNFKSYRWYQLYQYLKKFEEDTLINEFLKFLISHNMAQDTTLYSTDFIIFENLQDTLAKCNEFLDTVKLDFEKRFCKKIKVSDGRTMKQIRQNNRIVFYVKGFIKGQGWSEINYGLHLEEPMIYIEIYIERKNENHDMLIQIVENTKEFKLEKYDYGSSFWLELKISSLLNNENIDNEVANWFKNSFETFDKFISDSKLDIWNN